MNACCGNCRFGLVDGVKILCRANPPTVLIHGYVLQEAERPPAALFDRPQLAALRNQTGYVLLASQTSAHFPPMQAHGWCGKHEPDSGR